MRPIIKVRRRPWLHGWSVTLPHQCTDWETGPEGEPTESHEAAVESLREVIDQLTRALTVLEGLPDDWTGDIEVNEEGKVEVTG